MRGGGRERDDDGIFNHDLLEKKKKPDLQSKIGELCNRNQRVQRVFRMEDILKRTRMHQYMEQHEKNLDLQV